MAYLVELSERAEHDLIRIAQRISAGESAAAARWFNGLDRAIYTLESFPRRCPINPESKRTDQGLRHLLYDSMRIIYEIDEARKLVSVITIRHSAMDEFIA
jgi:plasmid stabilization system protein ParE